MKVEIGYRELVWLVKELNVAVGDIAECGVTPVPEYDAEDTVRFVDNALVMLTCTVDVKGPKAIVDFPDGWVHYLYPLLDFIYCEKGYNAYWLNIMEIFEPYK